MFVFSEIILRNVIAGSLKYMLSFEKNSGTNFLEYTTVRITFTMYEESNFFISLVAFDIITSAILAF